MSTQPRDDAGYVIPALGLSPGRGYIVPFTASSASNSVNISRTTDVVTITSTAAAFVEVGPNVVASNVSSHYILAGVPYDIAVPERSSIAQVSVIGVSTAGTLYISERS